MHRLGFLLGKWAGKARALRGPGDFVELLQTEEVQYKLDGLILLIEGIGRQESDGQPALQALGIISYDDQVSEYRLRAFNDGRFLETEVKLTEEGRELRWAFVLGEIKTTSVLRINDEGDWTELHEISIGSQPARELMELSVRLLK